MASSSAVATSASAQSDVISLDSDEGTVDLRMEWKRQEKEAHPTAAPVGDTNEVVDLLNSEEERYVASAKKERIRNPTSRVGRQPTAAAASGSRRAVQKLGNVIVI